VRTAQARFLAQGLALIVAHWPPHNSGVSCLHQLNRKKPANLGQSFK